MAWPGDAGGRPATMGADPLGFLITRVPALIELAPRIRDAFATYEKEANDPRVLKLIADVKDAIAEYEALSENPEIKAMIATIHDVAAVLSTKPPTG